MTYSGLKQDTNFVKQQRAMKEKAYNICREFLSGSWKKISASDMVFKSVT
jgi:hypothetical protein